MGVKRAAAGAAVARRGGVAGAAALAAAADAGSSMVALSADAEATERRLRRGKVKSKVSASSFCPTPTAPFTDPLLERCMVLAPAPRTRGGAKPGVNGEGCMLPEALAYKMKM